MNSLPEELLALIVSELAASTLHRIDLLHLYLVSRQFYRITEPFLYKSIQIDFILNPSKSAQLIRNLTTKAQLQQHVQRIRFASFPPMRLTWVSDLRQLQTIEVDIIAGEAPDGELFSAPLHGVMKFLGFRSVKTLRLEHLYICSRTTVLPPMNAPPTMSNDSITRLELVLSGTMDFTSMGLEVHQGITEFAKSLVSLRDLQIGNDQSYQIVDRLPGSVFRELVRCFQHSFLDTLRSFEFLSNENGFGRNYVDWLDGFDARDTIRKSKLLRLKTETDHLLRSGAVLRSLAITTNCLPKTLRSLYLSHALDTRTMSPSDQNIMHSEEAQCLSRWIDSLGRSKRQCPDLQSITFVLFLPAWFEGIASRVVRTHARLSKVQIKFIFMYVWRRQLLRSLTNYYRNEVNCMEGQTLTWPAYDPRRDPRHDDYNPYVIFKSGDVV